VGGGTRDWTAEALAAADERNLAEAFASFGRVPGAEVDTGAAMVRAWSGLPTLNGVIHARLRPDEADRRIDETKAWCAARGIRLTWYVGPTTTPADLGPRLEARGLTPIAPWYGMARTLGEPPVAPPLPAGVTVERVADAAGLGGVARAAVLGFGMAAELVPAVARFFVALADGASPWRFYLAREREVAVATAGLFLGTEVAGIYIVATVPEARRRGLGTAVTAAAVREARELGYPVAVLQASEMGHPIYRRLGFEDHYTFRRYQWAPPAP
jgi:GNAT superfamily N-acetyltransferase